MRLWHACMLAVFWLLASRTAAAEPAVVVGSKQFTESRILAEIIAQTLEAHTQLEVRRRSNLGGTALVFAALQRGEIDIYPEYTGTGWSVLLGRDTPIRDPLHAFISVQQAFAAEFELSWLPPFGFENGYGLAMREDDANARGIATISDLRAHLGDLRLGLSHEFLEREDGWPGLAGAYDLSPGSVRGMEHGLAYQALLAHRVDVIDTYTTDAKLERYPLRLLRDDRTFFPPYHAAAMIRTSTLAQHPEVRQALDRLSFAIDAPSMQRLNAAVEHDGHRVTDVARQFLDERGLTQRETKRLSSPQSGQWWSTAWSRRDQILRRSGEHLGLTLLSVVFAMLVGIPAAVALLTRPALAAATLGFIGLIQTIPSLALLALLLPIPGFGLGARTAVTALLLYALLPIVRNTYTGLRDVDPELVMAARGMGLSDRQTLRHVQLPLAAPTIMAGIRTAAVINVGVATLAAFVGAGGLGDLILTGLQLNDLQVVLCGAIPAAALALLVDAALGWLERTWTRT